MFEFVYFCACLNLDEKWRLSMQFLYNKYLLLCFFLVLVTPKPYFFSAMLRVPVTKFYNINYFGSKDTELFLGMQKSLMVSYLALQWPVY